MATLVLMPKLGLTMNEGTIFKWHIDDGADVKTGDLLYELETDKMTNEVMADADGVLHILHGEGAVVPCKETVAVIAAPGEDISGLPAPATTQAPKEAPAASSAEAQTVSSQPVSGASDEKVCASPKARKEAAALGIALAGMHGTGPEGMVTLRDLANVPKASPMAVQAAQAAGVDLASIRKDGRIMKQDVLDAVPLPHADMAPERVKMSAMRKAIARNMHNSWLTAPTVTYDMRADVGEMAALKTMLSKNGRKVSYTDILAKMTACALMEIPLLNSSIDGDELLLHKTVNLGIAVALDDGLVVPVIPNAERKGIGEISAQIKLLSAKAREGRLGGDDMTGGTFTITNLGMFGMEAFSPIINQPEVAILGVNAIVQTPVVTNGEVAVRSLMNLSLTADHRAVDGAVAARFLSRLVEMIENPWLILM